MSVNWQKSEVYHFIKQTEKDSGMSYAEQNAARGLSGHSIWGILGVQLFQGVADMALGKLEGTDTGSKTDISSRKQLMATLGGTLANFDRAIANKNPEEIDKYFEELKSLRDANPNNRRIARAFETAQQKKDNINQS